MPHDTPKFTPGNFTVGMMTGSGQIFNPSIIYAGDRSVASVYGINLHCTMEEAIKSGRCEEGLANAHLFAAAKEMYAALEACAALFAEGHAMSRFDWGKAFLRANDIRELNETPLAVAAALRKARGNAG